MSASASQASSFLPVGRQAFRHCPEPEWAAFVKGLPLTATHRRRHLAHYRRFVRTYPDLPAWFDLPLRERIGWRAGEVQHRRCGPGDTGDVTVRWINVNARSYLTYLALTGQLQMDWGWLLGVGVLKPWLIVDHHA